MRARLQQQLRNSAAAATTYRSVPPEADELRATLERIRRREEQQPSRTTSEHAPRSPDVGTGQLAASEPVATTLRRRRVQLRDLLNEYRCAHEPPRRRELERLIRRTRHDLRRLRAGRTATSDDRDRCVVVDTGSLAYYLRELGYGEKEQRAAYRFLDMLAYRHPARYRDLVRNIQRAHDTARRRVDEERECGVDPTESLRRIAHLSRPQRFAGSGLWYPLTTHSTRGDRTGRWPARRSVSLIFHYWRQRRTEIAGTDDTESARRAAMIALHETLFLLRRVRDHLAGWFRRGSLKRRARPALASVRKWQNSLRKADRSRPLYEMIDHCVQMHVWSDIDDLCGHDTAAVTRYVSDPQQRSQELRGALLVRLVHAYARATELIDRTEIHILRQARRHL